MQPHLVTGCLVSHDTRMPVVVLRALRSDRNEWDRVRGANLHYVGQWEPTAPDGVGRRSSGLC